MSHSCLNHHTAAKQSAMQNSVGFKCFPSGVATTDIKQTIGVGPTHTTLVEVCSGFLGRKRKKKTGSSSIQCSCLSTSLQTLNTAIHTFFTNTCRKALGFLARAANGAIAPPAPLSEKETRAFARELHTVNVGNDHII